MTAGVMAGKTAGMTDGQWHQKDDHCPSAPGNFESG